MSIIPLTGIGIFVTLYILAAIRYPGGSDFNINAPGFDWLHNYWCELMAVFSKNGSPNTGRPIALTALFILCFSLGVFWFHLPVLFEDVKLGKFIRFAGSTSMFVVAFLFTSLHDSVIHVAGGLGMFALSATFIGLYRIRRFMVFYYGMFCMLLMLLNYFVYQTKICLIYLPLLQKIAFLVFLSWIGMISLLLIKKKNTIIK